MTEGGQRPHFLVIDFRRVTGLDSSAVVSFIRLGQTAEREGFLAVVTGLSAAEVEALARGGFTSAVNGNVRFETDIERGLKWCEDTLLADVSPDLSGAHRRPLAGLIADIVPGPGHGRGDRRGLRADRGATGRDADRARRGIE
jgi:hypothetical protein